MSPRIKTSPEIFADRGDPWSSSQGIEPCRSCGSLHGNPDIDRYIEKRRPDGRGSLYSKGTDHSKTALGKREEIALSTQKAVLKIKEAPARASDRDAILRRMTRDLIVINARKNKNIINIK